MENLKRAIVSALLATVILVVTLFVVGLFQVSSGGGEWNTKFGLENLKLLLFWAVGIFVACVVIFLFARRK